MSQSFFDVTAARTIEEMYLTPEMVAQRSRVLDLLAPQPGERILDVGVGPGLLAHDLARMVGETGRLVGVDLSQAMVNVASDRLIEVPQAEVRKADAMDMELSDAMFDAAVAVQVCEHLPDPARALAELHRVLRPGGRAVILDTDWSSLVWRSSDRERMRRVLACWDQHLADPHLPGRLGGLARAAGFQVQRVEVFPILSPRWHPFSYAAALMKMIHKFVRGAGESAGLTARDIEAWRQDQQAIIDADGFFLSLNRYIFVVTK